VIAQHSSKTNEHYTPVDVVEASRRLMGNIDLDPASCAAANKRVQAARYYNRRDDGLIKPWSGRVFVNPPGGKVKLLKGRWRAIKAGPGASSMQVWWDHLARQWQDGLVEQAVFVGFTLEIQRTSQSCALPVQHFSRCYPKERLRFGGEQPTHANIIVYLHQRGEIGVLEKFRECFGAIGLCEGWSR
jgi:hypothetical protein